MSKMTEVFQIREAAEGGVLNKRTGDPHSISMPVEEFNDMVAGKIRTINITSTAGKPIATVDGVRLGRAAATKRGVATLLQVHDDPEGKPYYVVNFRRA